MHREGLDSSNILTRTLPTLGVLLLAVASAMLVFASSAAASVLFTTRTPPRYSVITNPTVQLQVIADDSTYNFATSDSYNRLTLDGVDVPTTLDFPNSSDHTRMRMRATVPLTDGPHVMQAYVRNMAGQTAVDIPWDFSAAVPPQASDFSPDPGTATQYPMISARVTDNGPGTPTATMLVNGVSVPATYDSGSGIISYTPSIPLADATTHLVTINMVDASGNAGTASWSFFVDTSATVTFFDQDPAPGAQTAEPEPTVRFKVTSSIDLDPGSLEVDLDGLPMTVVVTEPTPNVLDAVADNGVLADGAHTVDVRVADGIGFAESWSFDVQSPPVLSGPQPASGSTIGEPKPLIAFSVSDNTAGPIEVRVILDGEVIFDGVVAQGPVSVRPPRDLTPNATHNVFVEASDAAGNTETLGWSFYVEPAPAMSSYCTDCHTTYPSPDHPVNAADDYFCGGYCHNGHLPSSSPYQGDKPIDFDPIACGGGWCHNPDGDFPTPDAHGPAALGAYDCEDCHTSAYPNIPQHTETALDDVHEVEIGDCAECHLGSLAQEHARYPEYSPYKYQCTICHGSSDPRIAGAVAAGSRACGACHTSYHNGGSPTVQSGGYVSWADAAFYASDHAEQADGPHANYTVNTIKCGVCHSVHGAAAGGAVLTQVQKGLANPSQVCAACHGLGQTITDLTVSINAAGTSNSPHNSRCAGGCHTASVHGADASIYPTMASKLLTSGSDTIIADAIDDVANETANVISSAETSLVASDFTGFARANYTLATAYTCAKPGCHNNSAFGIKKSGALMDLQDGTGPKTGHPVLADVTTDWNFDGSYGVQFSGQVAWADANGCEKCHDYVDANTGSTAFPHNRYDTRLWMTIASDASRADETSVTDAMDPDASGHALDYYITIQDGACLKCHVSSDGLSGVGQTY